MPLGTVVEGPVARIPLRRRDGSLRAWTVVDADAPAWIFDVRWSWDHGYATGVDRRPTGLVKRYLHREVLSVPREDPHVVDHINHDILDNRRVNLRVITRGQNSQNRRPARGSTSRYRGVHWDSHHRAWKAQGYLGSRRINLGRFADEKQAAMAAQAWRIQTMAYTVESEPV